MPDDPRAEFLDALVQLGAAHNNFATWLFEVGSAAESVAEFDQAISQYDTVIRQSQRPEIVRDDRVLALWGKARSLAACRRTAACSSTGRRTSSTTSTRETT